MAKTFDHAVIYNGKFIPAFTPIEDEAEKVVVAKKATTEKAVTEHDAKPVRKPKVRAST